MAYGGNIREIKEDGVNKWKKEASDPSKEEIIQHWKKKQDELKTHMIERDTEEWQNSRIVGEKGLSKVAGVDISFIKNDETNACASVVVLELPSLKNIYSRCCMIQLTAPYIAGFLAFREAPHLVKLIEEIPMMKKPQLILVDGNGKLHHRCFGLACHLGALLDLPTVGVAKNLLMVDGLQREVILDKFASSCSKKGDNMDLIGNSGTVYGKVYQSTQSAGKNPIYISVGHRISLETAVWAVSLCCEYRIPQPIRQADLSSREYLRENFNYQNYSSLEQVTTAVRTMNIQK